MLFICANCMLRPFYLTLDKTSPLPPFLLFFSQHPYSRLVSFRTLKQKHCCTSRLVWLHFAQHKLQTATAYHEAVSHTMAACSTQSSAQPVHGETPGSWPPSYDQHQAADKLGPLVTLVKGALYHYILQHTRTLHLITRHYPTFTSSTFISFYFSASILTTDQTWCEYFTQTYPNNKTGLEAQAVCSWGKKHDGCNGLHMLAPCTRFLKFHDID